ncbi:hypothetical protein NUM3379_16180 [Kineococcus sp. NUM-3379]
MPERMSSGAPARRRPRFLTAPAALLLAAGISTGLTAPVLAAAPAAAAVVDARAVLDVAHRFVGLPYRYGGTTPAGFDCSGYTGYVYRQFGVHLPRTATQQMHATRRVSDPRPGDLVFFPTRGGRAYHVGIYAGDGFMYDSPRSGRSISKRKIWTSAVVFHRV